MGKDTLFNILSMKRIPCILLLFAFMMAGTSSLFAQTALEGEACLVYGEAEIQSVFIDWGGISAL